MPKKKKNVNQDNNIINKNIEINNDIHKSNVDDNFNLLKSSEIKNQDQNDIQHNEERDSQLDNIDEKIGFAQKVPAFYHNNNSINNNSIVEEKKNDNSFFLLSENNDNANSNVNNHKMLNDASENNDMSGYDNNDESKTIINSELYYANENYEEVISPVKEIVNKDNNNDNENNDDYFLLFENKNNSNNKGINHYNISNAVDNNDDFFLFTENKNISNNKDVNHHNISNAVDNNDFFLFSENKNYANNKNVNNHDMLHAVDKNNDFFLLKDNSNNNNLIKKIKEDLILPKTIRTRKIKLNIDDESFKEPQVPVNNFNDDSKSDKITNKRSILNLNNITNKQEISIQHLKECFDEYDKYSFDNIEERKLKLNAYENLKKTFKSACDGPISIDYLMSKFENCKTQHEKYVNNLSNVDSMLSSMYLAEHMTKLLPEEGNIKILIPNGPLKIKTNNRVWNKTYHIKFPNMLIKTASGKTYYVSNNTFFRLTPKTKFRELDFDFERLATKDHEILMTDIDFISLEGSKEEIQNKVSDMLKNVKNANLEMPQWAKTVEESNYKKKTQMSSGFKSLLQNLRAPLNGDFQSISRVNNRNFDLNKFNYIYDPSSIETPLNKLLKSQRNNADFNNKLVSPLTCKYVIDKHKHVDQAKINDTTVNFSNNYMNNFEKILNSVQNEKDDYVILEGLIKPLIRSANAWKNCSIEMQKELKKDLEDSISNVFLKLGLSSDVIKSWLDPKTGKINNIYGEPYRSCIEDLYENYLNLKIINRVDDESTYRIDPKSIQNHGIIFTYNSTYGLHSVFVDMTKNGTLQVYSDMFTDCHNINNRQKFIKETIDSCAKRFNISKDKIEVKLVENIENNSKSCASTSLYFCKLKAEEKLKELPGYFEKYPEEIKIFSREKKSNSKGINKINFNQSEDKMSLKSENNIDIKRHKY